MEPTLAEVEVLGRRCGLRKRGRGAAVRRAKGLEREPVAQLALLVAPVTGITRLDDCAGERIHLPLDTAQVGFVGAVAEHLAAVALATARLRRDHAGSA